MQHNSYPSILESKTLSRNPRTRISGIGPKISSRRAENFGAENTSSRFQKNLPRQVQNSFEKSNKLFFLFIYQII